MRNRLTAAFIVLSVLMLLGAGVVRAYVLRDLIREQESAHLQQQSALVVRRSSARTRACSSARPNGLAR